MNGQPMIHQKQNGTRYGHFDSGEVQSYGEVQQKCYGTRYGQFNPGEVQSCQSNVFHGQTSPDRDQYGYQQPTSVTGYHGNVRTVHPNLVVSTGGFNGLPGQGPEGCQYGEPWSRRYEAAGDGQWRRKRVKEAATYDGRSSWRDYLVQFEIVAEMNRWDDYTKAVELATNLWGAAQGVLSDLESVERKSYSTLVQALTIRFEPSNQSELFRAQLKSRLRKCLEPLPEFAQEVKVLVRKAYPQATRETREYIAKSHFLDALNDGDMEWAVFQGQPGTVDDAVRLALEFEAFRSGRKRNAGHDLRMGIGFQDRHAERQPDPVMREILARLARIEESRVIQKVPVGPGNNNQGQSSSRPRRGRCFNCGSEGHWLRDCQQARREQVPQRESYHPVGPQGHNNPDRNPANSGSGLFNSRQAGNFQ